MEVYYFNGFLKNKAWIDNDENRTDLMLPPPTILVKNVSETPISNKFSEKTPSQRDEKDRKTSLDGDFFSRRLKQMGKNFGIITNNNKKQISSR